MAGVAGEQQAEDAARAGALGLCGLKLDGSGAAPHLSDEADAEGRNPVDETDINFATKFGAGGTSFRPQAEPCAAKFGAKFRTRRLRATLGPAHNFRKRGFALFSMTGALRESTSVTSRFTDVGGPDSRAGCG